MKSDKLFILCNNQKKLLIKLYNRHDQINIKMDAIFINSENSKTFKPHILILNFNDKIRLRRGEKVLLCHILVYITHGKT